MQNFNGNVKIDGNLVVKDVNLSFSSDPQEQINKMTPILIYDGASNDTNINLGYPNGMPTGQQFQLKIPTGAIALIVGVNLFAHPLDILLPFYNQFQGYDDTIADYFNGSLVGKGNNNTPEIFGFAIWCKKDRTNFNSHAYLNVSGSSWAIEDGSSHFIAKIMQIKGVMV